MIAIGAGLVAAKNIADHSFVVGMPAKIIKAFRPLEF